MLGAVLNLVVLFKNQSFQEKELLSGMEKS